MLDEAKLEIIDYFLQLLPLCVEESRLFIT